MIFECDYCLDVFDSHYETVRVGKLSIVKCPKCNRRLRRVK